MPKTTSHPSFYPLKIQKTQIPREDPGVLSQPAQGEEGSHPVRNRPAEPQHGVGAEVDPALQGAGRGADAGGRQGRLPWTVTHGPKGSPIDVDVTNECDPTLWVGANRTSDTPETTE